VSSPSPSPPPPANSVRLVNDKGDSKIVAIAHLRVSGYLRREALKSANNATIVLRGPLFTKPVLSFLARYLTRRAHYCTTRLLDRAAPPGIGDLRGAGLGTGRHDLQLHLRCLGCRCCCRRRCHCRCGRHWCEHHRKYHGHQHYHQHQHQQQHHTNHINEQQRR